MILISINPDEFWTEMENKLQKLQLGNIKNTPQWLRSADVREMLNISDSTLQTMRINNTIPAYKLGTTWFYKYDEITQALEKGKTKGGVDAE